MAKNVGTAFVDIRADTTNFERQLESSLNASLKNAQGTAQNFGKTTNESLLSISRGLTDVGKNLSKKVTLPLVAIGTGALITAGNFEAGMNKVRAITGATESEIGQLSDKAKELGASTKFSATEAADAMSFLGMAGFETSQIMGAMPGTLQLAAAANMSLAAAADITSNVLSGFGMEVNELGAVNDALVKTLTRTNTDLSMLGQAFKFVGPVARGAGVTFNETAAAIGLLGNAGIQAGMAGTSLRGAITALLNPSKQASDIMQGLGINVHNASGELLPLNEIIEQLEVSGASTGEMMALFGQRAGPAMMALVEQGSGALRDLTAELDASGGTAESIANIQMEGLNGQMTALKSAVEGLMIAIAESGLLAAMTRFTGFLTNMARAASNLNPALMTAGAALGALAAAAGPLLIISGSLIRNFVTMRQTLVNLRNSKIAATIAAHGLRAAMVGIPLVAVAAGVMTLLNRFQEGRKRAQEFADGVKEISDRMGDGESATDIASERLKEFIDQSPRLQKALSGASFSFDQFVEAASTDMDRFGEMTDELMDLYGETFVGTIAYQNGRLASSVTDTMDGFRNELLMLSDGLSAGAESAAFWERETERSLRMAAQGFDALGDLSVEALRAMADAATREALQTKEAMSVIGNAAEIAASEVETELGKIERAAEDLSREVDRAMNAASSSFLRLSEEGKQNIDAFIRDTIEGAARLTVFQDNVSAIGAATSGEFANHLLAMGVDVEDLVRDLADPKKADDLQRAFGAWELATQAAGRNMADEFAKVDPEFKKTLDGIAGLTDTELREIRDIAEQRAVEIGTAMMQGQVEGIAANSDLVQGAIRSAVNQAIQAAISEAGISSPSRVMADQVGLPMAQGIAVGIEDGSNEIDAAMRRAVQETLLSAARELEQRISVISQRASDSFFGNLVPKPDDLKAIGEARDQATREFEEMVRAAEDLEKRISDTSRRTGDSFFKGLVPRPADLKAIEEVRDKVTGEITQMGREALNAGDVWIENMISQTKKLNKFQDNVTRISESTSGEFGLYLLEMGEEAADLVSDLADPSKVDRLNRAYAAWLDSTSAAGRDMVSEFSRVDPAFSEVLSNLALTIEDEGREALSATEKWIDGLVDSTDRLSGFQDNVTRIAGLTSGEFGLYLLEMGEEAEHLVSELADPQKVAALDQAYAAWLDSTSVATRDMVGEFAKVDPGFAEVLGNLNLTIEEEVQPAIDTARRSGSSAGSGLVSSMVQGIREQTPALEAEIARLEGILARREEAARPVPVTQGGPGGFGIEGEAGLFGGPLVNIQNANFTSGTDAQAVAQQVAASYGAMIPV